MKKQFIALFLCLFFILPSIIAQNSKLVLKERGSKTIEGTIYVADKDGKKDPTADIFSKEKYLHIFIEPEKGNVLFKFAKRDVDTIRTYLSLVQDSKVSLPVDVAAVTKSFPTKEFVGVLVSFEKSNVDIAKPFVFNYQNRRSDEIVLSEKYWLGFNTYYKNLQKSKELVESDPLKALELLSVFTPADSISTTFSFSQEARALFLSSSTEYLMKIRNSIVEVHNKNVDGNVEESDKAFLDELKTSWESDRSVVTGYFNENVEEDVDLLELVTEIDLQFSSLEASFATKVLFDYTYDEYKFELFVTLISKMLVMQKNAGYLQKLDPIGIENLSKFKKENDDLKQFMFYDEFVQLITLVNSNIAAEKFVFSPEVMLRLKMMRNEQPYPNYEIIKAFNSLAVNDIEMFEKGLDLIQNTTSDFVLMQDIEQWKVSIYYSQKKIDRNLIQRISDAIKLLEQNQIGKAGEQFELAYKLNKRLPVTLYYIGYTYYLQGQEYTGIKFFRKALDIDPNAIIPYIREFDFYRQEGQLDLALERLEVALQKRNKNWYFLSQKAYVLYGLERFEEAERIVIEHMIPINPSNVGQYFLLGDIYAKQENYSKARQTYNLGGDLDPTNIMFEEKMRALEDIERQGVILEVEEDVKEPSFEIILEEQIEESSELNEQ